MWIWSFQPWLWNSEAIVELLGYEAVHDGFDVAWASGNKTRVAFRAGCVFARWISGGSWLLSNPRSWSDWDFGWNDFALLAGQGLSSSVLPGSLQHMAVHASLCSVARPHVTFGHIMSYRRIDTIGFFFLRTESNSITTYDYPLPFSNSQLGIVSSLALVRSDPEARHVNQTWRPATEQQSLECNMLLLCARNSPRILFRKCLNHQAQTWRPSFLS